MPGVEELRSQADFADARPWAVGDASIYLRVDRERAPRAVLAPSYLETEAWSRTGEEPGDPCFKLSLWAHEGWLETIEIIPFTDESWPEVFPPPGDFEPPEVTRLDRGEATEGPGVSAKKSRGATTYLIWAFGLTAATAIAAIEANKLALIGGVSALYWLFRALQQARRSNW